MDYKQIDSTTPHPLQWFGSMLYGKTPDTETPEDGGTSDETENTDSQANIDRIIAERTTRYRRQLDDAKKESEAATAKLAEYEQAEETRRQKELEEQGKYQQLLEERDAKYKSDTQTIQADLEAARAELRNIRVSHALDSELVSTKGINPKMIPIVKMQLQDGVALGEMFLRIKSEKNDAGDYETVVVDRFDSRLTNGKGAFMTVADAKTLYLDHYPEFILPDSRTTGSGATGGGGSNQSDTQRQLEVAQLAAKGGNRQAILEYMRLQRESKGA